MALLRSISVVVLASSSLGAQTPPSATDFRQAVWGMNRAQVLATESAPPSLVSEQGAESVARYAAAHLAGLDCRIVYIFARDKLVRTKYVFQTAHQDQNDYLADFAVVDAFLTGALNRPGEERVAWRGDSYKKEPRQYGAAIAQGELQYSTQWKDQRTIVTHALTGSNGALTHEIEYVSVELEPWEDQAASGPALPVAKSQPPVQAASAP